EPALQRGGVSFDGQHRARGGDPVGIVKIHRCPPNGSSGLEGRYRPSDASNKDAATGLARGADRVATTTAGGNRGAWRATVLVRRRSAPGAKPARALMRCCRWSVRDRLVADLAGSEGVVVGARAGGAFQRAEGPLLHGVGAAGVAGVAGQYHFLRARGAGDG